MSKARCILLLTFCACLAPLEAGGGGGEVIDRISVTVGKQVITESQVSEEIRCTAFLNGKPPDWSADNRAKTLNRLVDQTLIRREIETTRFPVASPDETAKMLAELKPTIRDFGKSLAAAELTEAIVAKHLEWQLTFLRFVEYRFKPSLEITETELTDFYQSQSKEWKAEGKPVPPFEEVRTTLEKALYDKLVDQAIDQWLGDQRIQIPIVYKHAKQPLSPPGAAPR